jgi:hypothetical protein
VACNAAVSVEGTADTNGLIGLPMVTYATVAGSTPWSNVYVGS